MYGQPRSDSSTGLQPQHYETGIEASSTRKAMQQLRAHVQVPWLRCVCVEEFGMFGREVLVQPQMAKESKSSAHPESACLGKKSGFNDSRDFWTHTDIPGVATWPYCEIYASSPETNITNNRCQFSGRI